MTQQDINDPAPGAGSSHFFDALINIISFYQSALGLYGLNKRAFNSRTETLHLAIGMSSNLPRFEQSCLKLYQLKEKSNILLRRL